MLTGRCTDPHKTLQTKPHTRTKQAAALCFVYCRCHPKELRFLRCLSFGAHLRDSASLLPASCSPFCPFSGVGGHFLGGPSESPWGKYWGCSWGQAGLDPPKGLAPAWSCLHRCVGSVLRPHLQLCLRAVPSAFCAPYSEAWSPASSRAHQGWGGWCGQQLLSWYDLSGLRLPGKNEPGCRGRTHPGWGLRPRSLGAAGMGWLLWGRWPSGLAYSHCLSLSLAF